MFDTTERPKPPTTSDSRPDEQSKRFAEDERDFKAVRAAIYLLRVRHKRASAASVQRILVAAFGVGLRKKDICACMKRVYALETQDGNQFQAQREPTLLQSVEAGTGREPDRNQTGTTFKHDGNHPGTGPEHHARDVNVKYVNIEKAATSHTHEREQACAHEDDQANDLATEALRETGGMTQTQRDANKARMRAMLREAAEKGLFRAG